MAVITGNYHKITSNCNHKSFCKGALGTTNVQLMHIVIYIAYLRFLQIITAAVLKIKISTYTSQSS